MVSWQPYTVSGGILLRGTLRGTPVVNSLMLLIGTALASWMGTTGAAMLMIRPFLRANNYRKNRSFMVVFFIFLVANIGGSRLLDPVWSLPRLESTPSGVYPVWSLPRAATRGRGDVGRGFLNTMPGPTDCSSTKRREELSRANAL